MAIAENRLESCDPMVELRLDRLRVPAWILRPLSSEVIDELERSIESTGLLQPIVVRRIGDDYEVVFGNHRLEACKRLGMKHVRVIIRDFTDEEAFLARVSENLIRNEYVDRIEEAEGYKMLIGKGWTINAIGRHVGKCDSYICERLALLDRLSPSLRSKVSGGVLAPSHAELLSRITDETRQEQVAELVRKKRLSVRSLEDMLNGKPPPAKIQVESMSDEFYVRIPGEFAQAVDLNTSQHMFVYLRGNRLILESTRSPEKSKRRLKRLGSHRK